VTAVAADVPLLPALVPLRLTPGSLPWLVWHDVRVKARSRQNRMGRIVALIVLAILPVVAGIALAWQARDVPMLPVANIGVVAAGLLGLLLAMLSSAYAHVLRLGRDRGELELMLSAPLPVARVMAARVAGVQAVVALPFLMLSGPFFIASALLGHWRWLAGPIVVVAIALVATALALLIATLLERLLGPRIATTVAQVVGVGLAALVFALGQAPNFAPRWFEAQLQALKVPPPTPLDWPARALFGDPAPLLFMCALALAAIAIATEIASARLEAAAPAPATVERRAPAARFGGSPSAVLYGKELTLLWRDPELITQIGQQMVFMVPVVALIFADGRITPERMASAGVFLGGALASSLAWLMLCAEDAPDLIATAPVRPVEAMRAKLAAVLTPPAALVLLLALVVTIRAPLAALLMLPMALAAALATSAMQAWTKTPARRSAFRQRYRSSLLMAVGEFVVLGALAAATRLILAGNWWSLAALAVPVVLLTGVWIFRIKPAE
jgi:ABC-2 type transport system permease protein